MRNLLWNYTANNNQTTLPSEIFTHSSYAQQWGNIFTLGTIHLAPNSHPFVAPFVQYLQDSTNNQNSTTTSSYSSNHTLVWNVLIHSDDTDPPPTHNRRDNNNGDDDDESSSFGKNTNITHLLIRIHPSQAAALKYIDETGRSERTWAFLDFTHWKTTTTTATTATEDDIMDDESYYSIRMNYTTLPATNLIVAEISTGLNPGYQQYFLSGYLTMQRTLNEFAFAMANASSSSTIDNNNNDNMCTKNIQATTVFTIPMPTVEYEQNTFYMNVGFLLGMTVTMSFLFPVAMLIKNIVQEKESRQREMMYIAGLRPWLHCLAWWLTAAITFTIVVLGVTWTLSGQILQYSSFWYLLALVGSFGLATIGDSCSFKIIDTNTWPRASGHPCYRPRRSALGQILLRILNTIKLVSILGTRAEKVTPSTPRLVSSYWMHCCILHSGGTSNRYCHAPWVNHANHISCLPSRTGEIVFVSKTVDGINHRNR
jgi:hypothetical protein